MMVKVGFTASRFGMTEAQAVPLSWLFLGLATAGEWEFHHGDCVGGDAQGHTIAVAAGARTIAHPPLNAGLRAHTRNDVTRTSKDYLKRDLDIVSETTSLVACPRTATEEQRSGTWTTVRYARKMGKRIVLILPDGSVKVERPKT